MLAALTDKRFLARDSIDAATINTGNPALLAEHFVRRFEFKKPLLGPDIILYSGICHSPYYDSLLLQNNVLWGK
jgi:hypothetical protein